MRVHVHMCKRYNSNNLVIKLNLIHEYTYKWTTHFDDDFFVAMNVSKKK